MLKRQKHFHGLFKGLLYFIACFRVVDISLLCSFKQEKQLFKIAGTQIMQTLEMSPQNILQKHTQKTDWLSACFFFPFSSLPLLVYDAFTLICNPVKWSNISRCHAHVSVKQAGFEIKVGFVVFNFPDFRYQREFSWTLDLYPFPPLH